MDKQGFTQFLEGRKQSPAQIEDAIQIVEEFEAYQVAYPAKSSTELVWDFSKDLIQSARNSLENYLALARYALFAKQNDLFVPLLELLDGEESMRNLNDKLGELYDEAIQAEIFQDFGVPPLGTPTNEKPKYTVAVMQRLTDKFGDAGAKALIKDSLRTLPDESYLPAKENFAKAASLDAFLDEEGERFMAQLQACKDEGRLFFAQEITQEVLDYFREHPEIYRGEREGNIVYEVKIPFLTQEFLNETDPVKRNYYYCHCPWAREAILQEDAAVPGSFCNCSAGFHKKRWEIIYGQPIKAEVVESVLMGDERCRFAIHLPE